MKQFTCGDVVPGCQATFEAETEDALLAQVAGHAKTDHDIDPVPDDLVAQVRGAIREAA